MSPRLVVETKGFEEVAVPGTHVEIVFEESLRGFAARFSHGFFGEGWSGGVVGGGGVADW